MARIGFPFWPDRAALAAIADVYDQVDYVEVAPETLWGPDLAPNGFYGLVRALAEGGTPIVGHGVGLDLASDDRARRARWLAAWRRDAAALGLRWASDHLGRTSICGEPVALPLPAPAAMARLGGALDGLAAATGAPAGVENSAWYSYPGDARDEPARLTDALGDRHHLVLDLHNLWTNAINLGFDAAGWVDRAPLDRVLELHVSGGSWAPAGWRPGRPTRLDSHDGEVPTEVWALLGAVGPRCPRLRGVTLEWIEQPLTSGQRDALDADLARLRALVAPWGAPWPDRPRAGQAPIEVALPARTAAEVAEEQAMSALVRAPSAEQGVAHRLIVKLRFERLLRGSTAAEAAFLADPEAFVARFGAYHRDVAACATPWDEAAAWEAWGTSRRDA